ncbi:Uncharacterized protein OBRU01_15104 [Operophtera brumata]|uniref:UDP-glycosyltransferase n=1 Tax=Operophtera brumata TaxID=104452 RepID=A0A0L7L568_OPEBR|nr:Uncharacterized protein OBRU01_15104 [Operophtera brumata]
MSLLELCLAVLILYTTNIDCARILGVYATPSISHQVVFRALSLELVNRGHEVVVITPDPAFRNKIAPENLTEIDIGQSYGLLQDLLFTGEVATTLKRGVIMDLISVTKLKTNPLVKLGLEMLLYPEVKRLIADKSQKFDLVLVEALSYSALMFSKIYNAPAILFSSFYGTPDNFFTVGAVSRHPVLHPHFFRYKFRDLSITEKIKEFKNEWDLYKYDVVCEQLENEFLKSEFGVDAPTVHELKDYVELLFVNAHPIFDGNRPVPPGVVYLGALHLKPTKPLPADLQAYLDGSTRGVIYVSLGTNVRPSMMDQDLLDAFLKAFEALPYDIMWKFDGDSLERTPKNFRIQKWFPQRDLLAIDAELPMVGVPFLGDQWFNVNKYVELGIGIEVDSRTLTADKLVKAAQKVIGDDSFRKNISKLHAVMRDQPDKPLDRAVWWTEYVLRHGRSKSLLGTSALMSWSEYLMMDLFVIIVAGVTVAVLVATAALYYVVSILMYVNNNVKRKQA